MKPIAFIFLLLIICTLNSCCTKRKCLDFSDANQIQLFNFTEDETDSISIQIYHQTDLNRCIDSSFTKVVKSANDFLLYIPELISKEHIYKINFISIGKVYTISNFVTSSINCNCRREHLEILESYQLNGQQQNSLLITITK